MPEPTASLRFVLTGGDLTFSGNDDTNPLGLVTMTEPPLVPRVTYAADSDHVGGSLSTQAVPAQTTLTATVGLKATSQVSLEAQKAALKAAAGAFHPQIVQEVNGYEVLWIADMGSVTPIEEPDSDYVNLRDFEAFYALSFAVRPTGQVL